MSKQNIIDDFNEWQPHHQKLFLQARNEVEKEKALAEIRKQKEEEEYRRQILRQNAPNSRVELEKISSESESSDSLQSEDDDWKKEEVQQMQPKEEIQPEPTNEQLDNNFKLVQNVQLKRDQIFYLLMKHFCDNVIEGAFVKINEPNLSKRKEQNYIIAQVLAVVEGEKSYQLEQTQTYKLLKLQFGEVKDPKLRHITLVSNQQIQKQEFVVWQKKCEENGIQTPNKEFLLKKEKDIALSSSKLTDDQIKKRINTNLDKWIQNPRSNIHFHDLPVYQNFIRNLISTNKQIIDQGEEHIAEIQESNEGDGEKKQLKSEEQTKIQKYINQNKLKQEENMHLSEELKKIETLLKNYKESQSQRQEQSKQADSQPVVRQIKPTTTYSVNHEYQKLADQKFIRQYPNLKTIDGSEQFKAKFLQMHQRDLEIDNLIDKMILTE